MCGRAVRSVVMPASPPNTLRRISDDDATSSPMPSEIIANTVPARFVITQPIRMQSQPADAAGQRNQGQRQRPVMAGDRVHDMDGEEAAEAVLHGVTERQQPGLAEQDVVGQREHDRDADQAERRQRAARRKDQRQHDQRGCCDQPDAVKAGAVAGLFRPLGAWRSES